MKSRKTQRTENSKLDDFPIMKKSNLLFSLVIDQSLLGFVHSSMLGLDQRFVVRLKRKTSFFLVRAVKKHQLSVKNPGLSKFDHAASIEINHY
jgi:hypothetical protein